MTSYIISLLLLYIGLYLFFVISKAIFHETIIDKIIFCPVCGSFFTGFLLGVFVFHYPPPILYFLGGVSAVGTAMYLNEEKVKRKIEFPFDFFLITLFFVMLGVFVISIVS